MTQEEFNKLADREVRKLNGSTSEDSREAWKAGYLYVCEIIESKLETCYNEEFIDEMVELSDELENLEIFE